MIDPYTEIPDAPLEPPEEHLPIVFFCDECEEPIYQYHDVYTLAGRHFCSACVENSHSYAEVVR